MLHISTPAIMLRRLEYGDSDLICTFFSLSGGKITLIAKSAKKSIKRFPGILEPFSIVDITYVVRPKKGMPVLSEASLIHPLFNIRREINKTAYAGYMAELIYEWVEEQTAQPSLYELFQYVLESLDRGELPEEGASILFQMRFMQLSGLRPNLRHCMVCKTGLENILQRVVFFDLDKGGLVCENCKIRPSNPVPLSKATLKQLLWVEQEDLKTAARIRFSPQALKEGLNFLEAFVPLHLGKNLRSLKFLHQIRK